jgi:hypothetical protein
MSQVAGDFGSIYMGCSNSYNIKKYGSQQACIDEKLPKLGLILENLKNKKISKKGGKPSRAIQFEPLKMVKTFTTKFTKDFKVTIPSLGESIPPPPPTVIFSVKKGDRVSVTEFFNGRTIYVIDGDKWYNSQLKNKKDIQIGVFDKTLNYDNNKSAYRVDESYWASNSKLGFGDPIKNKKWLVYGLIAVAGYFAYKKFIK